MGVGILSKTAKIFHYLSFMAMMAFSFQCSFVEATARKPVSKDTTKKDAKKPEEKTGKKKEKPKAKEEAVASEPAKKRGRPRKPVDGGKEAPHPDLTTDRSKLKKVDKYEEATTAKGVGAPKRDDPMSAKGEGGEKRKRGRPRKDVRDVKEEKVDAGKDESDTSTTRTHRHRRRKTFDPSATDVDGESELGDKDDDDADGDSTFEPAPKRRHSYYYAKTWETSTGDDGEVGTDMGEERREDGDADDTVKGDKKNAPRVFTDEKENGKALRISEQLKDLAILFDREGDEDYSLKSRLISINEKFKVNKFSYGVHMFRKKVFGKGRSIENSGVKSVKKLLECYKTFDKNYEEVDGKGEPKQNSLLFIGKKENEKSYIQDNIESFMKLSMIWLPELKKEELDPENESSGEFARQVIAEIHEIYSELFASGQVFPENRIEHKVKSFFHEETRSDSPKKLTFSDFSKRFFLSREKNGNKFLNKSLLLDVVQDKKFLTTSYEGKDTAILAFGKFSDKENIINPLELLFYRVKVLIEQLREKGEYDKAKSLEKALLRVELLFLEFLASDKGNCPNRDDIKQEISKALNTLYFLCCQYWKIEELKNSPIQQLFGFFHWLMMDFLVHDGDEEKIFTPAFLYEGQKSQSLLRAGMEKIIMLHRVHLHYYNEGENITGQDPLDFSSRGAVRNNLDKVFSLRKMASTSHRKSGEIKEALEMARNFILAFFTDNKLFSSKMKDDTNFKEARYRNGFSLFQIVDIVNQSEILSKLPDFTNVYCRFYKVIVYEILKKKGSVNKKHVVAKLSDQSNQLYELLKGIIEHLDEFTSGKALDEETRRLYPEYMVCASLGDFFKQFSEFIKSFQEENIDELKILTEIMNLEHFITLLKENATLLTKNKLKNNDDLEALINDPSWNEEIMKNYLLDLLQPPALGGGGSGGGGPDPEKINELFERLDEIQRPDSGDLLDWLMEANGIAADSAKRNKLDIAQDNRAIEKALKRLNKGRVKSENREKEKERNEKLRKALEALQDNLIDRFENQGSAISLGPNYALNLDSTAKDYQNGARKGQNAKLPQSADGEFYLLCPLRDDFGDAYESKK